MTITAATLKKGIFYLNGLPVLTSPFKPDPKNPEKLENMTVKHALVQCLRGTYPDEQFDQRLPGRPVVSGYDLHLRYALAIRLRDVAKEVTLSEEEEEQLKITIEKGWRHNAEVLIPLYEALSIKPKKPEKKEENK